MILGYCPRAPAAGDATSKSVEIPTAWLVAIAALATFVGGIIRFAAAHGDLWLDEILSLRVMADVSSAGQIFLVNYDNNHLLNSLYIYVTGPSQNPLRIRGLGILCGTLAIPAAGLASAGPDRNRLRALMAMTLVAVSFPMVYYGSQGRGYAGFELFSFLSLHALNARLPEPARRSYLGFCTCLGILSHPLMVVFSAGQCLSVFLYRFYDSRSFSRSFCQTARLFSVSFFAIVVYGLYSLILRYFHPYIISFYSPPSFVYFTHGFLRSLSYSFGLYFFNSKLLKSLSILIGIFLSIYLIYISKYREKFLLVISLIFCVLIPVSFFICRIPNLYNPRYFFCSWIIMLILFFYYIADGCEHTGWRRRIAIFAGMAFFLQNSWETSRLILLQRGHYAAFVHSMDKGANATYSANLGDNQRLVIDYYAHLENIGLKAVPISSWCEARPDWLVLGLVPLPERLTYGPLDCTAEFEKVQTSDAWGFEVYPWALYRRVP